MNSLNSVPGISNGSRWNPLARTIAGTTLAVASLASQAKATPVPVGADLSASVATESLNVN